MGYTNRSSSLTQIFPAKCIHTLILFRSIFVSLLLILPLVKSLSFSFPSFNPNLQDIYYEDDAHSAERVIELTKNQVNVSLAASVGRASYAKPVRLWDKNTRELTSFSTHFSFEIKLVGNSNLYGDGFSFFLVPFNSSLPLNSSGGALGLVNGDDKFNNISRKNQFVAVEFDTFRNYWDPKHDVNGPQWDPNDDHVGIDVDSILSVANVTWAGGLKNKTRGNAWVSYDSATHNLSVFLTYADNPVFNGSSSLWHIIDLRSVLPEMVRIGFSAATGLKSELHTIFSWDFNSTLADTEVEPPAPPTHAKSKSKGGFGGVYLGVLIESRIKIAVKKVSKGSKQGKKEFASEVKIISRLRHRNLVQLLGWCHEWGDLLLVYEFMPNGSLDSHLYGGKKDPLSWTIRYKIALGLASALLYLHEEWEQCVVHRDIKSSNVMLDSNFNAKLGDFGLARLIDHELGSQTTVLAGTFGYLAPECATTGKASKESDVYSFGVVALEIVCGRRPIESKEEPAKVRMVEWVWNLYGKGLLLEAIDRKLEGQFDVYQTECLMMVGLWCCHPDHTLRPSISQVISVLKSDASLPILPSKFPVPVYLQAPMIADMLSFPSSSGVTGSSGTTSSSAQSIVSGSAPLLSSI